MMFAVRDHHRREIYFRRNFAFIAYKFIGIPSKVDILVHNSNLTGGSRVLSTPSWGRILRVHTSRTALLAKAYTITFFE